MNGVCALSRIISLLTISSLLFHDSDAGQVCAACSDIVQPDDCQHHVRCADDESCYIRRYVNESGTNLYELGCSSPQACYYSNQPIIGKRANGKHFKCLSCCNETALCNQFSDCIVTPTDSPAMCASCGRMNRPANCQKRVQCDKGEKCYMHKYSTEAGSTFYDLGCITAQACPPHPTVMSRKPREVHHLKCMACCTNDMCNRHISDSCDGPLINQSTTIIQTTTTSQPMTSSTVTIKPKDCSELSIFLQRNGSYTIYPDGFSALGVTVYCEFSSDGAWTVFQRRIDGSVDFYRNWTEYKAGFGDVLGNVWMGNDAIHYLTSQGNYRLKIRLTDWSYITKHAFYSTFRVANESQGYQLTVSGYSGNAAMERHNLQNVYNIIRVDWDVKRKSSTTMAIDYDWYK